MHPQNRIGPLVASACLAAMLSGCGGSSNMTMEAGMTGGTDTGMTGGTVTGPTGFTAGVDRLYPSNRTVGITDDGMTMITETTDGWNVTIDGKSVEYSSSDLGFGLARSDVYAKRTGNVEVWFWSEESGGFEGDPAPEFDHLNIFGFSHNDIVPGADLSTFETDDFTRGDHVYVVYGTPTAEMPAMGTATYDGRVEAREWPSDSTGFRGSTATLYTGDFDMTATFGASATEVRGMFSFDEMTAPGGTTTSVSDGDIPFTTTVTGNHLSLTVPSFPTGHFAGYENVGVRAAFFGPEAEEVGGVFVGENPTESTLIQGYFAADSE